MLTRPILRFLLRCLPLIGCAMLGASGAFADLREKGESCPFFDTDTNRCTNGLSCVSVKGKLKYECIAGTHYAIWNASSKKNLYLGIYLATPDLKVKSWIYRKTLEPRSLFYDNTFPLYAGNTRNKLVLFYESRSDSVKHSVPSNFNAFLKGLADSLQPGALAAFNELMHSARGEALYPRNTPDSVIEKHKKYAKELRSKGVWRVEKPPAEGTLDMPSYLIITPTSTGPGQVNWQASGADQECYKEFIKLSRDLHLPTSMCMFSRKGDVKPKLTCYFAALARGEDWKDCRSVGEGWSWSYKVTRNAAISGHNDRQVRNASVGDCQTACSMETSFQCLSFDYWKQERRCDLSSKTAKDVGGLKRDYPGHPFDHYARRRK